MDADNSVFVRPSRARNVRVRVHRKEALKMSALTDFLHKLVDIVGVSSLHGDIDELAKVTDVASKPVVEEKAPEGETPSAVE